MQKIKIKIGVYDFIGVLEYEKAPRTVEYFLSILPLEQKVIHVR